MGTSTGQTLRLICVAGPDLRDISLENGKAVSLGRGAECEVSLVHESVSRRHAMISFRAPHWLLTDLGSKHGTYLNAVKLNAQEPAVMTAGDVMTIGPWTLRVAHSGGRVRVGSAIDDTTGPDGQIERISRVDAGRMAEARLTVLMACAGEIHSAADEAGLNAAMVQAALRGSEFQRAAILRTDGHAGAVEIAAFAPETNTGIGATWEGRTFSRSLLREAARGDMAVMTERGELPAAGLSIVQLGITAAICAPLYLGTSITAYLYADMRNTAGSSTKEAAAFCQILARLYEGALGNLKRQELERRQRQLEADVAAARAAQELILPSERGEVGVIRYAMRMKPGRMVAGDLFDVIGLDERRTAVCIGDVAGAGAGAAVLMAAAQSHLHSALVHLDDVEEAVRMLNRYVATRTSADKFLSLWVGVFDRESRSVRYVDAGHGHWMVKKAGETAKVTKHEGGIPMGIDAGYEYRAEELKLMLGDRVLLFSDGVVEQRGINGELFGKERLMEAVQESKGCEDDVMAVIGAVERFAGTVTASDDTTVAAIGWRQ